ncbi:MAG: isopropylmalate isomerase [Oleibacter sp.]|nr:isopropylmalate isomerase [Thalassolituus sp.]
MEDLLSEPTACSAYRQAYVDGFEAHVEGLSEKQDARRQEGIEGLNMSQELLARNGLDKDDCTRPLCIIEPQQGGKLDSWCGYRVLKTDGSELYQWFEWSIIQP